MTTAKIKSMMFQPVESVLLQVPRALVASILAALLDCGFMVFLVETRGWQPVAAAVISYFVGGVLQYVLCSLWVFPNSPSKKTAGFLAFMVLSLGGLAITWLVMAAGGAILLPYGLSKVLALGMAFVWNFSSRKFLLFSAQRKAQEAKIAREEAREYSEWLARVSGKSRRKLSQV